MGGRETVGQARELLHGRCRGLARSVQNVRQNRARSEV